MKTPTYRRIPTQFGPDVTFEVTPTMVSELRAAQRSRFEELHERMVDDFWIDQSGAVTRPQVRQAALEAAALAWSTAYPLLVMPVLFQEVMESTLRRAERQRQVRRRSRALMAAAL